MAEDPFVQPMNYSPPSSAVELLERYALGHRFFARASLRNAQLLNANLQDVNLTEADLFRADLSRANLRNAVLDRAFLRESSLFYTCLTSARVEAADLYNCRLCDADLTKSVLRASSFWCADLDSANFSDADLSWASLRFADLTRARMERALLTNANLVGAQRVDTVLDGADISGSRVYGVSAWSVSLNETKQQGLIMTDDNDSTLTVDNLEVAQFVYLLLNNEKIRSVINTIGEKGVLILGRFTEGRKRLVDAIRNGLRELGFVPMMFDFEKPTQRDFTETIQILAGMSRFIIADISNPKSSPLELQGIVPDYMIPFVPIIHEGEEPFSMFRDLKQKYDWVLDVLKYDTVENLLQVLERAVVRPALEKGQQLLLKKAQAIQARHVSEYM